MSVIYKKKNERDEENDIINVSNLCLCEKRDYDG